MLLAVQSDELDLLSTFRHLLQTTFRRPPIVLMPPNVDLVIPFAASTPLPFPKHHTLRHDTRKAEIQYSTLLNTLSTAGLRAVGRRGEKQGHILVFVSCPRHTLSRLVKRERCSDFLNSLPTSTIPSAPTDTDTQPLTPAERIRIVHDYVTSTPEDGGLGVVPLSPDWSLVESVLVLHDRRFNDTWIRSWSTRRISATQLDNIRDQFGDAVALYFSFLSSYTYALIVPAAFGVLFYLFGTPYSPLYSVLLLLWSTAFVEYWRVKERILSTCWGSAGSFKAEKRRPQYVRGIPWWARELRMLASVPIIVLFALVLAVLLTAIFVFEAFVTELYTGPGHKYISLAPTILFVALVPRVLALYRASAVRFTVWENHFHPSTHAASLTLKTFALSAVVAYLGLALSAFVYVPFGEGVMEGVQGWLFSTDAQGHRRWGLPAQDAAAGTGAGGDASGARQKLNPSRLYEQMFAYTVTNQVVDTLEEVALPFVLRALGSLWGSRSAGKGRGKGRGGSGIVGKKKRVVFEDEVRSARGGGSAGSGGEHDGDGEKEREEREFLGEVRNEVTLPDYELFGDYSEMVTQFGYVALWSAIWPLAPVMALVNNVFELRSDAFKITVHYRRPVPQRADTIGPWLDALEFLAWLAALTNAALVFLFRPVAGARAAGRGAGAEAGGRVGELLVSALLVALAASHGYTLVRGVVRHVVRRAVWRENPRVMERERGEREVRERLLRGLDGAGEGGGEGEGDEGESAGEGGEGGFWGYDEGLEDIQKIAKDG